ncbi:hypothetical protein TH53_22735 [Pedobacter lusitanus]|uniref:Lipoyl-binding domain-containing protein n=1 Tax=Pedobacter lusitanus TaxID=1503925 RepID=A0A0D0FRG9_9SPHI|nr:biotin/lipoyl-containing protein [Pedobacter lusitanus]KIO75069.1 hypothetical protein TH53_22735 [Pedobacter lusitanus]
MQDYYKQHTEELHYFKNEARKAFAVICDRFGFREEDVVLSDTANLFQITFSNSKTRIVVEGIHWGMNTNVCLGINNQDSDLCGIHQLIKEREPEVPVDGSQAEQIFGYAHYLLTYATDILEGDTTFFNQQKALRKEEKENAWKAMQAESARKISEGYLKIDTPYGERVWRKPRPSLSTYHLIKDKFPDSFEVMLDLHEIFGSEQEEVIINNWKTELGDIVIKDEVICEISTDKVWVEIVAPQTGRLIWLLEEGIAFKFSTCIALLDLQFQE